MQNKRLIYGCMGLGGSWNSNSLSAEDYKIADNIIETAIESGITHFDHADIYAFGKAEKVFGTYLKRNPEIREKIFLQSKTGIVLQSGPLQSSTYNLSRKYILTQVDNILDRLSTDYMDALLVHRPDPLTSMEELSDTLRILKKSGKVKSYGVSNMSTNQIKWLQSFLDEPLISNQIQLSLSHSLLIDLEIWVNRIESPKDSGLNGLLAYSQMQNLNIQAYSPLAQGKYGKSVFLEEKDLNTTKLINELAEKYNSSTSGILLAWIWKIPANITPIIGTTNLNRIQDSVNSLKIELSREDWYKLWITAQGRKLP